MSEARIHDRDLEAMARRLMWWKSPDQALADPHRLLAQVMVLGTADDIGVARRHFSEDDFRRVLERPPPGVFDPRSWAYWHLMLGLETPKEIPGRKLPEGDSTHRSPGRQAAGRDAPEGPAA